MADYKPRTKIEKIFRETKKREVKPSELIHLVNNGSIHLQISGDVIIGHLPKVKEWE